MTPEAHGPAHRAAGSSPSQPRLTPQTPRYLTSGPPSQRPGLSHCARAVRSITTRLRPSFVTLGIAGPSSPQRCPSLTPALVTRQQASDWLPVLAVCVERDWSVSPSNRRRAVGFKSRALGPRSLASLESLRRPWADVELLAPRFLLLFSPPRTGRMAHKQIYYSDKYFDEHYEYR